MRPVKSERYRVKELELEYALQMQREKALLDFLLTPPGCYLVGLYGSLFVAYIGALITPKEKRTTDMEDIIKQGITLIATGPPGLAAKWATDWFTSGSPLAGLFKAAGAGGSALFTALLLLNEMKPDGSGDGGGVLGTLLKAV